MKAGRVCAADAWRQRVRLETMEAAARVTRNFVWIIRADEARAELAAIVAALPPKDKKAYDQWEKKI